KPKENNLLAASPRLCCQTGKRAAALALKPSRVGLNIEAVKLFVRRPVLPVARVSCRALTTMNRIFSAFVLMSGIAACVPAADSALAAAPIPDIGGAPVPSLAPMLARITPGVVNIAVRGKVRSENPLLQDPFFRRFFDLPQRQQPQERETQATGSGVI